MSVSRRGFLVAVPALGAAVAVAAFDRRGPQSPGGWEAPSVAPAPATFAAASPVVSFHLDQPYLDLTGTQKPYVPPTGLRSGASLAALGEEELLSRYYGFI